MMTIASLAAGDLLVSTFATSQGVIVQLKGDPVIVAKTIDEANGHNLDDQELATG